MKTSSPVRAAFTLIELLTVIAIIVILMGLILSTAGYIQDKAARDRANGEIHALETAMESYKADNGIYPRDENSTDKLDARTAGDPADYDDASLFLYKELSGDTDANGRTSAEAANKDYIQSGDRKSMLKRASPTSTTIQGIIDPWGNFYGYSTAYAAAIEANPDATPNKGYNPTFDLWSTANKQTYDDATRKNKWIKNW